jgi:hypothetical protein
MAHHSRESSVRIDHEATRKRFFVAFETLDHRYFLEEYDLPNYPKDKMLALQRWHRAAIGRRQSIAESLLCKKLCIKIGTLGVSSEVGIRVTEVYVPELTSCH